MTSAPLYRPREVHRELATYVQDPNLWPRLLLGPIVRRVDASSVSVFVATREPMTVELELFVGVGPVIGSRDDSLADPGTCRSPFGTTARSTIPLGQRLHVALVRLDDLALMPGIIYGYNVVLVDATGLRFDLKAENLLNGEVPLGYVDNLLPGFVLPPEREHLRIVHASCRKPHGEGVDMIPTIDMLIGDDHLYPLRRPHQLFLTGDQIYADDVAPGLLPALTEAAGLLLGWEERLPNAAGQPTWSAAAEEVAPGRRSEFLNDLDVQERTSYSANHLLFFGEWCAMYLMAWSNALWRPSSVPWHTYRLAGDQAFGTVYSPATRRAVQFAEGLRYVRRAMANIATYMMFDDHEVTDDWNLNLRVNERFRSEPMGRRLVRNALCAYAVFQDWGNQPDDYTPGTHGGALLAQLTSNISTTPDGAPLVGAPPLDPVVVDEILDLGTTPAPVADANQRKLWHYTVYGPEHAVLAFDTRTWRTFPPSHFPQLWTATQDIVDWWELEDLGKQLNAGLVSSEAMQLQLQELADAVVVGLEPPTVRQPIVISPAPVLGMWLVETMQRLGILKDLITGDALGASEKYDNEPWSGHADNYVELLDRLAQFSPLIVLSGDVHYSFSQVAAWDTGSQLARVIQLTCSASRNSLDRANAMSIAELFDPRSHSWHVIPHGVQQAPHLVKGMLRSSWDRIRSFQPWSKLPSVAYDIREAIDKVDVPFVTGDVQRVFAGPVTLDEAEQLADLWTETPGEARLLKTATLVDSRSTETRDDDNPRLVAELAGWAEETRNELLNRNRGSISINNVGVVSFIGGTPQSVQHELYWRHSDQPVFADIGWPVVTRHQAELRDPLTNEDVSP